MPLEYTVKWTVYGSTFKVDDFERFILSANASAEDKISFQHFRGDAREPSVTYFTITRKAD